MDNKPEVSKKQSLKYKEFADLRLNLPKIPLVYKLRRVYWLLNNVHRKLQADPTAITTRQYLELLDVYCDLVEEVEKKGLHTADGRKKARQGMDTQRLGKVGRPSNAPGVGSPFSPSLGAGISTSDTPA